MMGGDWRGKQPGKQPGGFETRPYCHHLYSRSLLGGHKARPTMGMVESMRWQAGGFVYL
jgi:hypothetical protein